MYKPVLHQSLRRDCTALLRVIAGVAVGLGVILGGLQQAPADERYYNWDIANAEESFPQWLRELPVPKGLAGGRRDFQVIPPRLGGNLAITLFFDEPAEGQLRVLFRNADHGAIITPNLFEGTGLPNQRTIILRENLLYRPGVLSLYCSEPELPVWRLQFQWLRPQVVLVPSGPPQDAPQVMLPNGQTLTETDLPVTGHRPAKDLWRDENFSAVLNADPLRLEEGVEFVFDLGDLPAIALLRLEMAGAPLEGTVWAWLNGQAAVPLQLALPPLAAGGFRQSPALDAGPTYTGWRTGTAFIPPKLLKSGQNTLHLQFLDPYGKEVRPETVARNVVLDIQFPRDPRPEPEEPEDREPALDSDSPELLRSGRPPHFVEAVEVPHRPLSEPGANPFLVPIPGMEDPAQDLDAPDRDDLAEAPFYLPDSAAQAEQVEDALRLFLPDLAPALEDFLENSPTPADRE